MGRPIFRKDNFLVTQDVGKGKQWYYTVVKDIGLHKKNPHAHFNNYKAAKLAMHFAMKNQIPGRYPGYMKAAILRLMQGKQDVLKDLKSKDGV
jgi:hypothetical protein